MQNNLALSVEIVERTRMDGGCTLLFNRSTEPQFGFFVGRGHEGVRFDVIPEPVYVSHCLNYFIRQGFDGLCSGLKDGQVHVYPIIHVGSLTIARMYGYMWDESAVWDCLTHEKILLDTARRI